MIRVILFTLFNVLSSARKPAYAMTRLKHAAPSVRICHGKARSTLAGAPVLAGGYTANRRPSLPSYQADTRTGLAFNRLSIHRLYCDMPKQKAQ
jgi:hypothetical protein